MAHKSEWWTNFLFSLYVAGEVVFVFLTSLPFLLVVLVRKTFSGSGKKITGKTVLVSFCGSIFLFFFIGMSDRVSINERYLLSSYLIHEGLNCRYIKTCPLWPTN